MSDKLSTADLLVNSACATAMIGVVQLGFGFSWPEKGAARVCRWIGTILLIGAMVMYGFGWALSDG